MFACMMHSGVIGILVIYLFFLAFYKGDGVIKLLSLKRITAFLVVMILVFLTPLADKVLVTMSSINMRKQVIAKVESIFPSVKNMKQLEGEGEINIVQKTEIEVLSEKLMNKTEQDYRFLKGNTSYIKSNPTNIKEAILQTPYRYVNFVFAPFIWQVYDIKTFASFLFDGLFQLFIWFSMIKWVVFDKDRSRKAMIIKMTFLIMILGTYFIYSWGTYTYGTAIRHRAKMLPLMLCIIARTYDWDKLLKKIRVVK